MSTEDQKPITKAEVDAEIRLLFELLKGTPPEGSVTIKGIKEKIAILKTMKQTISD